LLPVVLGGMALFVLTDIYRKVVLRRKHESSNWPKDIKS
jgi:hypothetical protein